MRYAVLATDYDGTLARDGRVDESTIEAMRRLAGSGRKLLLVTGRELADLRRVFTHLALFDRLVVENGAVIHDPATNETRTLSGAPPPAFVAELERRGVTPLSVGDSIVATWHPHEHIVLEVIRELGLELQVIFNKGAVMVLPAGTNKASGVLHALRELGLSPHNMVAIGDAENDHALLELAECGAAVANAVPMLKAHADIVTRGDHGLGVEELTAHLIANDLGEMPGVRAEQHLLLGTRSAGGDPVVLPPAGANVLIAGSSGSGKSTLATSLLEQLLGRGYQCCVVDPEGDYDALAGVIHVGGARQPPEIDAVLAALEGPDTSVVVNLLQIGLPDRPAFLATLLLRLQELRARTGRPHWIVLDEAHMLAPAEAQGRPGLALDGAPTLLLITLHPEQIARELLDRMAVVVAIGQDPASRLASFVRADASLALEHGETLVWLRGSGAVPFRMRAAENSAERQRHRRKYAEGELGEDRSFWFRGPDDRLKLRAQNLMVFLQMADGVDDDTWQFHLAQGDVSRWLRECIKDEELALEVEAIERRSAQLDPHASRAQVREGIEKRYTAPATS